jgi:excisionase family DNA binding protein
MQTPLKNAQEAAGYLGLSKSTLAKLRLTGDGPHYVRLGRRVLYDVADLDSWIAARKRSSTSDAEVQQ